MGAYDYMTKEIREALVKQAPMYTEAEAKDIKVIAKYFNPVGVHTWYAILMEDELEPGVKNNDIVYCLVPLFHDPSSIDCGVVSLKEITELELPNGLRIERDLYFPSGKYSMQDIFDGARP